MAKKSKIKLEEIQTWDRNMISTPMSEVLDNNYMPYAMSVISDRALPDVRDGLKPSHRKLLYTMYEKNLLKGPRIKSATIAGAMMVYNPHGDAANYETLVRLSRDNETLLTPLIDNKGSMGKHYSRDRVCASSRYTEAKLMPVVQEFFRDINKNGVDIVSNYDGTTNEPLLLPTTFPHILINPNLGIAVGMACNICSFNFKEICNYTSAYIKDKNIDIHEYIKGPDFATGATLLYNKEQLDIIYQTGRGSFKMRSKYKVYPKEKMIIVNEIPFSTTFEAITDEITSLGIKGKLPEVRDVRDESDIEGLKIAIDYKKDVDPEALMKKLFKRTSLESSFSCNFNVLTNNRPRVMGINQILDDWIAFRIETIKRTVLYDLKAVQDKLHLLYGLEKFIVDIDKVISIIRNTELDKDVIPNLRDAFEVDKIQAEYIVNIRLRNINKEFLAEKTKEIMSLEKELKRLTSLLKSNAKIKQIICKELDSLVKTYGIERKTQIEEFIELEEEDTVIENYETRMVLTEHHYIKKIKLPLKKEMELKIKEDDAVIIDKVFDNHSEILGFTDKGNFYKLKISDLTDSLPTALGDYLPSLFMLDNEESLIKVIITKEFKENLLFIFENGKVARIPLTSYQTKTNRKKLLNAYSQVSPLVDMYVVRDEKYLGFKTTGKKELFVHINNIPLKTTKNSIGVQVIKLNKIEILKTNLKNTLSKKEQLKESIKISVVPKG